MKFRFLIFSGLMVLFFFGEIAISFSDKTNRNSIINDENLSFALNLENSDSHFEQAIYIDKLFESFIEHYNIKGASVSITKDEKLIYAKGFGMANEETGQSVQPGHLFRLASVSKLITAVAVIHMAENNILSLDDKVFGKEGILNDEIYLDFKDKRFDEVSVRQLLNHTAGWSRRSGDPLFNSDIINRKMKNAPGDDLEKLIRYELKKNLYYNPGTEYSYSNLGYAILGKIIEKKSGLYYEDYVVMNVLKPMGINDMHIGSSLYHEKLPNEVRYYEPAGSSQCLAFDGSGRMVPKSYGGNNIPLIGPAGGWVASSPELAKFLCSIDGFNNVPDFLDSTSVYNMADPKSAGKGLFGWRGSDQHGTWWRTGSLSGTSTFVVRMENGLNWVVLLNTSSYKRTRIHNKLSKIIFAASYRVKEWPEYNLFTSMENNNVNPIEKIPVKNPEL
ncbi:MAG: beta-lactamase family protein [Bacteroidales bacterium]|nr:beta-lactamase family protein [Bacteroidales bacterium]